MPTVYALMVAINDYPNPRHKLRGCVNDLNLLKSYLEDHFKSEAFDLKIKELKNENAIRDAIIQDFSHFDQAKDGDICLFYYSGHGSQVKSPMEFWHAEPNRMLQSIVCWDSRLDGGRDLLDKEISYLIWNATRNKNVHFLSIMDSCHSGGGTREIADSDIRPRMTSASPIAFKLEEFYGHEHYTKVEVDGQLEVTPPRGRHLAISAAQDKETAKESVVKGQIHGFFTYNLVDTLRRSNGQLSYNDLVTKIKLNIANQVNDQSPQLYAYDINDSKGLFLNGAIAQTDSGCQVYYDKELGWLVNLGSVQGLHASVANRHTVIELKDDGTRLEVTDVFANSAAISGMKPDKPKKAYDARVVQWAAPMIQVGFDKTADLEVKTFLTERVKEQPPYYFELSEPEHADYIIKTIDNTLRLTKPGDDRPVFRRVMGYDEVALVDFISKMESVGKWRGTLEMSNPNTSIDPEEIKVELYRTEPGNFKEDAPKEKVNLNEPIEFRYDFKDGEWVNPGLQLAVTNTSHRELWVSVLYLGDNFIISNQFMPAQRLGNGQGPVWMEQKMQRSGKVFKTLRIGLADEYLSWGVTEITEHLKVIISTDEIDTKRLNQPGLPLDERQKVPEKFLGHEEAIAGADWTTKDISFTIIRPMESLKIAAEETKDFQGLGISVSAPSGFSADLTLTPTSEATRAVGVPPPHQVAGIPELQALELTTGHKNSPGLSVMELYNAQGKDQVTADNPLVVQLKRQAQPDETILPIGYDPETGLYYPLGGEAEDGKILIETLPDESESGTRSLGGSIKIFFQKVIAKKLFGSYDYPLLQLGIVDENEELEYVNDKAKIIQAVADARSVAVFIHGIIGDTSEMVKCVRRAKNASGNILNELYDAILTFDYENLETPIEETARDLKQRLAEVGLTEGHGKQLHLIAHSMGGLVSRWFIEKEGGDAIVTHLVQLGTPNLGSQWASVQEMASVLLSRAINGASFLQPWLTPLSIASRFLKSLFVTLQQMNPAKSEFLKTLNDGTDPGIPYTIVAGNTSLIPVKFTQNETKLFKRILSRFRKRGHYDALDTLLFKKDNDIAVTVESILGIPQKENRKHVPVEDQVACDHISYFADNSGLTALADTAFGLLGSSIPQQEKKSQTVPAAAKSTNGQSGEVISERGADTIQITEEALEALLQNEDTAEETLHKYFDFQFSSPLHPTYTLKSNVEIIHPDPGEGVIVEKGLREALLYTANRLARYGRRKRYRKMLEQSPDAIRIVSEGDSWFQHPHPRVRDTIDHLMKYYAVYSIGAAGDELRNMFQEAEYLRAIREVKPKIFLMSGGGNDILGSSFRNFLNDKFSYAPPGINTRRFLKDKFFDEVGRIGEIYKTALNKLVRSNPDMSVILHGYDYVIPGSDPNTGWVGRYLLEKKIEEMRDCQGVIKVMIDAFNEELAKTAAKFDNVYFLDLRRTVRDDQWYDEIHPNSTGFQDVSVRYQQLIDALT